MKFESPPINLDNRAASSTSTVTTGPLPTSASLSTLNQLASNGFQSNQRLRTSSHSQNRQSVDLSQLNRRQNQLPAQFAAVSNRSEYNEQETLLIFSELNSMFGLNLDEETSLLVFRLLEKRFDPTTLAKIISDSQAKPL